MIFVPTWDKCLLIVKFSTRMTVQLARQVMQCATFLRHDGPKLLAVHRHCHHLFHRLIAEVQHALATAATVLHISITEKLNASVHAWLLFKFQDFNLFSKTTLFVDRVIAVIIYLKKKKKNHRQTIIIAIRLKKSNRFFFYLFIFLFWFFSILSAALAFNCQLQVLLLILFFSPLKQIYSLIKRLLFDSFESTIDFLKPDELCNVSFVLEDISFLI